MRSVSCHVTCTHHCIMAFLVSLFMKCVRATCGSMKAVAVVGGVLAATGFGWLLWKLGTAFGPVPPVLLVALVAAVAFKLTRPKRLPVLYATPQRPGTLRVVLVSDTHCKHGDLTVPPGDVLLHAGDFTRRGTVAVRRWLARASASALAATLTHACGHTYRRSRASTSGWARCRTSTRSWWLATTTCCSTTRSTTPAGRTGSQRRRTAGRARHVRC